MELRLKLIYNTCGRTEGKRFEIMNRFPLFLTRERQKEILGVKGNERQTNEFPFKANNNFPKFNA